MKMDENCSFTITNAGFMMKHSGFNYESLWFSHEIHDVNYTNSKNIGCSLANMFQTPGPRTSHGGVHIFSDPNPAGQPLVGQQLDFLP